MNKKISIFGKKIRISHIILFVVMMIIAGIMIAPFLWVFSASLVKRLLCHRNGFRHLLTNGI